MNDNPWDDAYINVTWEDIEEKISQGDAEYKRRVEEELLDGNN